MEDIYGEALKDYYNGLELPVHLYNSYGQAEDMPMEVFFRTEEDMPELELRAIKLCRGRVLDIGAGAGAHSILLQERRVQVTALEQSAGACEVMRRLGVKNVVHANIMDYTGGPFDTLLLMMNGIGLVQTVGGLRRFLTHVRGLLVPRGQIVLDSSDINYLYTLQSKPRGKYYGEITFAYEYKGVRGPDFGWLYIDFDSLNAVAIECGYTARRVYEDGNDQYLAVLALKNF